MSAESNPNILITGGAGFIGSNLTAHLLHTTRANLQILDNFSRAGVKQNAAWLMSFAKKSGRLKITEGDVRDAAAVQKAATAADEIYHFAAQVAVTTSVASPVEDCDINIKGTLNILEAARLGGKRPLVLFTSTNKVYGSLAGRDVVTERDRYVFADRSLQGVDEEAALDFHSPYGCSKGAADQYVRDYARIYDLPTIVFRMSCIAGPRQFGNEDQGWIAHFLYSALEGRPITIYGDGRQVRDVLHVHDLMEAIQAVREHRDRCTGEIYNVGGGPERAVSVLQVLENIRHQYAGDSAWSFDQVRPGDQPIYITDFHKLSLHTGWHPRRSFPTILADIYAFWQENRSMLVRQRNTAHNGSAAAESDALLERQLA